MSLGECIYTHRKKFGMNQRSLAKLSGISSSTISRIEKNQLVPRSDVLALIANALQVSPNHLLGFSRTVPLVDIRDFSSCVEKNKVLENENHNLKNDLTAAGLRWDLLMSTIDELRERHDFDFQEAEKSDEEAFLDHDDRMCAEGKAQNRGER